MDVSNAELERWLTRVEAKVDKVLDDHEDRLRRLERFKWVMLGTTAAASASGIGAFISSLGGGS